MDKWESLKDYLLLIRASSECREYKGLVDVVLEHMTKLEALDGTWLVKNLGSPSEVRDRK